MIRSNSGLLHFLFFFFMFSIAFLSLLSFFLPYFSCLPRALAAVVGQFLQSAHLLIVLASPLVERSRFLCLQGTSFHAAPLAYFSFCSLFSPFHHALLHPMSPDRALVARVGILLLPGTILRRSFEILRALIDHFLLSLPPSSFCSALVS